MSSDLQKNTLGQYEYVDDACTVSYDFWRDGGEAGFVITNNSNQILYVDLSKSFFIRNGIAYDYSFERTISTYVASTSSSSSSQSGTAYGYWNTIGSYVPGAISATKVSSGGHTKSTTVSYKDKEVVAIPPYSSKFISEYLISPDVFYDCDYNITPKRKEAPTYSFDLRNSPIVFTNYITYHVGGNATQKVIDNQFYVDTITFLSKRSATSRVKVGCPQERSEKRIVNGASPVKFYIKYERSYSSHTSSSSK